ncbi:MAG: response regulator [Flavobacterium sp.]|nr:MAG: response regulator [Flavobacterium sp.]
MAHKVLIIEDDVEDQILFVETIQEIDEFCQCECAGNGSEGIDYLLNTNTLPSIILLDLNMPLMNGFEFLEKVKKMDDFRHIPIYIFSTSKSMQDEAKTRKLGAKSYFMKPNNIPALRESLNKVFADASSFHQ